MANKIKKGYEEVRKISGNAQNLYARREKQKALMNRDLKVFTLQLIIYPKHTRILPKETVIIAADFLGTVIYVILATVGIIHRSG
jgi:hypothetical protein